MLKLHRPCFILGVLIFSSCWGHGFEGNGRIHGSKQRWNTWQTAWQPQRHSSRFSRRRPAQLFQGCGSRWWHSHATFGVIEVMCMYFVTFRALTRMLVVSYLCLGSKSIKKTSMLRMYLWWSLYTLYLLACQMRVTVDDSGLCCCVCVMSLES